MDTTHRIRADPAFQRALQLALCRQLFSHWPWLVGLSALGPAVQALALARLDQPERLVGWLSFCAISALIGAVLVWRRRHTPSRNLPRLARWLTGAAVLHGLQAGLTVPLFVDPAHPFTFGLLPATICALAGITVVALSAHRPAMLAMLGGLLVPPWFSSLFDEVTPGIAKVSLPLAFFVLTLWGWRSHAALRELLSLRLENRALTQRARRDRDAAERADRAKSRFLAVASHDLRQPMQGMLLQLEALQIRSEHHPAFAPLIPRLARSAAALAQLLDGLWEVARIESSPRAAQPVPLQLTALLEHLAAEYRPRAAQRGLRLQLHAAPELCLYSDSVLLQRILRNLLENALRYTERGGILLAARRRGNRLQIEVWDTGVGIGEEDQAQVFEEFFRASRQCRPAAAGMGLGLAVGRRLAERLGGSLSLRSRRGRGSVFVLSLDAALPNQLPVSECPAIQAPSLGAPQVALLDPDQDSREALATLLGHWGCRVVAAASLDESLAVVSDLPAAPDLLIATRQLGADQPSGMHAVERLRDEFNQPIPALLLSADSDDALRLEVARAACRLVIKPIEPAVLRAMIAQMLYARGAIAVG